MFKILTKINDACESVIIKAILLIMTVLTVATFLQVFSRYVLNNPYMWTEEVVRFAFVWMVFLGASVGVRRVDHFMVDIIYQVSSDKIHKYIQLFSHLVILIISLILLIAGYQFSLMGLQSVTATLRVSNIYRFLSVFMAGIFMTLFTIENITKIITGKPESMEA